jgi:hypothetical protein
LYDATELLAKLSEAHGPSGYEGEVRKLIVAEASRHADRIEVDALGSVFARAREILPKMWSCSQIIPKAAFAPLQGEPSLRSVRLAVGVSDLLWCYSRFSADHEGCLTGKDYLPLVTSSWSST